MSEQDATHYKDAEKIEESLDVRRPLGLDERLAALAEEVLKGKAIERSWDAVRMLHFPERLDTLADQEAAAVELSDWARRRGIEMEFRKRAARIGPLERYVIYALFTPRCSYYVFGIR